MLPQIRMEQTYAQIGLQTEPAVQRIRQHKAELNLHQEPAILQIKQSPGTLHMDSSKARANMDLKGILQRNREYANLGRQKALEAIAQISQEGDQLRAIERKGNPIASIAETKNEIFSNTHIIHGDWTTDGIDISYERKAPEIKWQIRGMKLDVQVHKTEIDYKPGKVEVYVRQKQSLQISVTGGKFDEGM